MAEIIKLDETTQLDFSREMVERAYDRISGYSRGQVRGQINHFPEGQFVALYDGRIVGYCASMRVDADLAFAPHDWEEITANGFGSRHDPTGAWLYGYEMCVDPKVRGVRIGQRLYDARKTLAERLELKGIVIGGRMPGYQRNRRKVDGPAGYLEAVATRKLRDPVVSFQLRNGFEIKGVLENYLPEDKRSDGNAALRSRGQIDAIIAGAVTDDGAEFRHRVHHRPAKRRAAGGDHRADACELFGRENFAGRFTAAIHQFKALADAQHHRLGEARIDQDFVGHRPIS